mmetsp:Transcript_15022/g.63362  ORF Transcript_15022/g.63362 Transcript_15022/m.63362 type:complete len:253 (-) Transcript_15022:724-1482(-)
MKHSTPLAGSLWFLFSPLREPSPSSRGGTFGTGTLSPVRPFRSSAAAASAPKKRPSPPASSPSHATMASALPKSAPSPSAYRPASKGVAVHSKVGWCAVVGSFKRTSRFRSVRSGFSPLLTLSAKCFPFSRAAKRLGTANRRMRQHSARRPTARLNLRPMVTDAKRTGSARNPRWSRSAPCAPTHDHTASLSLHVSKRPRVDVPGGTASDVFAFFSSESSLPGTGTVALSNSISVFSDSHGSELSRFHRNAS